MLEWGDVFQVLSSDDGFLQLMDDMGSMREDLRVPGQDTDIGKEIKTKLDNSETFLVSVLCVFAYTVACI